MVDESGTHPVGGVGYPRTRQEFDDWFSSEAACLTYLQRLRWRESFRCPKCAGSEAWKTNTGHLKCRECRHRTSATAGTIFDRTQKPLRVWFQAMWYVTSQKSGGSALGLQQVLGLGSYQTAWSWLHKLRRAMVRPGRDRLHGCVEVDETYVGGDEEGVRGRQTEDKAIVVVAAEEDGRGIGRIRPRRVHRTSNSWVGLRGLGQTTTYGSWSNQVDTPFWDICWSVVRGVAGRSLTVTARKEMPEAPQVCLLHLPQGLHLSRR
jgi:hypothetical protein